MSVTREEVREWLKLHADFDLVDENMACARAALDALEDAERWQYLATHCTITPGVPERLGSWWSVYPPRQYPVLNGQELHAAIAAARREADRG